MALAASTTIFEKNSESLPINFEDIEVLAALIRHSSPKDSTVYVKCSYRVKITSLEMDGISKLILLNLIWQEEGGRDF